MVALLENLSQAGRIKTQTHTLAPDVGPAGLTAFLYLIHCPVQRQTNTGEAEMCEMHQGVKETNSRSHNLRDGWGGVKKYKPWCRRINRIGDLQASEVHDTLQKNLKSKSALWACSPCQKPTSENVSDDSQLFFADSFPCWKATLPAHPTPSPPCPPPPPHFCWLQDKTIVTIHSVHPEQPLA